MLYNTDFEERGLRKLGTKHRELNTLPIAQLWLAN